MDYNWDLMNGLSLSRRIFWLWNLSCVPIHEMKSPTLSDEADNQARRRDNNQINKHTNSQHTHSKISWAHFFLQFLTVKLSLLVIFLLFNLNLSAFVLAFVSLSQYALSHLHTHTHTHAHAEFSLSCLVWLRRYNPFDNSQVKQICFKRIVYFWIFIKSIKTHSNAWDARDALHFILKSFAHASVRWYYTQFNAFNVC